MENTIAHPTRSFVPESVNVGDWTQLEPLFLQLLEREIDSVPELEQWLLDSSELAALISEERSRRYIQMTCHTDDADCEQRYLEFVERVEPRWKSFGHKLRVKYFETPSREQLPKSRYEVLNRNTEADIRLFREENIPLQTEETKLSQTYQKLCGAMTVEFDGQEQTLPQMAKVLEETDRSRRQAAWEKTVERRLQDREQLDQIFSDLIRKRNSIARNAGFEDFKKYAFLMYKRFDYTVKDCQAFHAAVEREVVPLARRLAEKRRKQLGLETLRPWDVSVDPLGRPPLRPFETVEQLCSGCEAIFRGIEPILADRFVTMKEQGELDLDSRKGKAPGGYLSSLDAVRRPFIFMNAAGLQRDVETLLHECGHAFHLLECRDEPLLEYREAPLEFAEVASMAMELFGSDSLTTFYDADDAARAKRKLLEGIIEVLPWIARIDAFQLWIYKNPKHVKEERTRYWLELDERYGIELDWSGYEAARETSWQKQLHLYCCPFYYIEYGIAQLGALQLWRRFKTNPGAAIRDYRAALALGGAKPLPYLFETAGAQFDFSEETIKPLIKEIERELATLPE
ncbi:MAG: M3 family oligoendopeptidase [bacterium]|jgi:oligoendopeptidase F|nr:M3 family oligoendopeptidase [bacterium]